MKKFLLKTSLAIATLLAIGGTSHAESMADNDFIVDSIAYAITSYDPATVMVVWNHNYDLGDITIPQTIDALNSVTGGYSQFKVTAIDNYVFENSKTLTSIKLPSSIETIGTLAFDRCVNLKSVTFYGGSPVLKKIGDQAFYNCESLETFELPNSLEEIGISAFEGCTSLTGDLIIPNSVTSIGEKAFYGCSGLNGSLTIGDAVTTIGNSSFSGCSGLTGDLVIPDAVTSIGTSAFYGCSGFNGNLTIGDAVTSIGSSAFRGCSGFTGDLTIGNSLKEITSYLFYGCSGFTGKLTIGNSVSAIGNYAFNGCSGLTGDLIIPDAVTSIGISAFYGCSGFNGSLIIGDAVTTIGNGAFRGSSGFTGDLIIGNSLKEIGSNMFEDCSNFTGKLTIGDSVTSIGSSAFRGCSGFTGNLIIPNSVTDIGQYAFSDCNSFTGDLIIPDAVISIGDGAFYGCSRLCSVDISDSIKTIGNSVFSMCSGLLSVAIPNSVTTIGDYAFYDCISLSSVVLPNSVTAIGGSAFRRCSCLTSVFIPNSVITIGESAFRGCSGLYSVAIPNSVTAIGDHTFYECTGLTMATIGNSVTNIGNYAFYSCANLTSVTIGNSVTSIGFVAFEGCDSLAEVNITDLSAWCKINFENYTANPLFYAGHLKLNGTEITNLVIPNDVTEIKVDAFRNCIGLTSVTISNSVTSINSYAFWNCTELTSVTIGNSITSIGQSAFEKCASLTEVNISDLSAWCKINFEAKNANPLYYAGYLKLNGTEITNLVIPNDIAEIKDFTFYGGRGISGSLSIPNSIISIGNGAFAGCSGLNGNLVVPNSVTTIETNAFLNCSGFTGDLIIPDAVISIGDAAFHGCREFNGKLTLGKSLTTIGGNAFCHCDGLTGDLIIPNSVTTIGGSAFRYCGINGELTLSKSLKKIENYAFAYCKISGDLIIPDSVTTIDYNAFEGGINISTVTLKNTMTTIGDKAFRGCRNITRITSLNPEPPVCESSTFEDVPTECCLIVPTEGKESYATATGWSQFTNIIGLDDVKVEVQGGYLSFEFLAIEGAVTYTVNVYSDEAMTQLTATTSQSTSSELSSGYITINLSIDNLEEGSYYYVVMAKSTSDQTLRSNTGSFEYFSSGINKIAKDENGYYLISTSAELTCFASLVNGTLSDKVQDKSACAKLVADIDLENAYWVPMCETGLYYKSYGDNLGYTGVFDGNGHVIKNIKVRSSSSAEASYGLFGTVSGTIKNLGIESFTLEDGGKDFRVGAIVGQLITTNGKVSNCFVRNATITPGDHVSGGIAGCAYEATIENCYVVNSTITGANNRFGHIVGDTRGDNGSADRKGSVNNCYTDNSSAYSSQSGNISLCQQMSESQFASGEVAYLLQGDQDKQVWGQNIDNEEEQQLYPELYSAKVYCISNVYTNIIGLDDVKVEVLGDNATFEIPTTEEAVTYTVNVYSDEAMTQLVATTNYDAAGNIIPMSTSLELSIDGFANGTYYYNIIAKSESGKTLNSYTGSFEIITSGINSVETVDNATEVARYDIHGRLLSEPTKGINIVKYSDGTVKKIIHN